MRSYEWKRNMDNPRGGRTKNLPHKVLNLTKDGGNVK